MNIPASSLETARVTDRTALLGLSNRPPHFASVVLQDILFIEPSQIQRLHLAETDVFLLRNSASRRELKSRKVAVSPMRFP